MKVAVYSVALFCVVGLAVGQILFKMSAIRVLESGTFFALKPFFLLMSAVSLYGVTSVAWVWVLQRAELGRIYPIMALAFVLVPLGSFFIFGEQFNLYYFLGVAFISVGIVISVFA